MYKVSILVPVYNVEQYIERCARSLFGQTYTDLEFVFVNDCTPDRSMEILGQVIKDYPNKDSAVKIIDHERNRGVAATRNTALDNATGDFVFFVDADDWLELNAIELLVKKQLETNADVVTGGRIAHHKEGEREIPLVQCETNEEMACHMMGISGGQYLWGRLIRRQLMEDNAIRCIDGYDCAEDRFVMAKVSFYAGNFGWVEQPVYHYERRNATSIMYSMTSNVQSWLKTGCQEVSNYVALQSFFEGKNEFLLLKKCKDCMDSIVEYHLIPSLECVMKDASGKDFQAVLSLIDNYPLTHSYLNWPKEGTIGRKYVFFKPLWSWRWFRRKTKRYVDKKWKKLIVKKES